VGRSAVILVLATLIGCAAPAGVAPPANLGAGATPSAGAAGVAAAPCAPEPACHPATEAAGELAGEEHGDEPDDGEVEDEPIATGVLAAVSMSDAEIEGKVKNDVASLGPMSVGLASAGALVNAVEMPQSDRWKAVDPGHAWGTRETIDYLTRAIDAVHERWPGSPKMFIGHISARNGGRLSPHLSHQAGRDVDVSYYLDGNAPWYARATEKNLDRARTWTFVRTLITDTDAELILIDSAVQRLLKDYAASIGEPQEWLDEVFQVGGKGPRPLIRHAKGHATHIHVRFYNPVAQELGRRAMPYLVQRGLLKRPSSAPRAAAVATAGYVEHRARSGDTLGSLARRYGVSVQDIQRANNLRGTAIRAKNVYKIPKKGAPAPSPRRRTAQNTLRASGPVVIPPRRIPPGESSPSARSPSAPSP
jgi:penicillin-insensitive murein endopeptidase